MQNLSCSPTLAGISTIMDEEAFDETDEGTLKNIDLLSAFNDSTSDDVSSLVTDDETTTLVDQQSAIEDSLIASDELQSALMLYNDGFPAGQETIIENGKYLYILGQNFCLEPHLNFFLSECHFTILLK